MMSMVPRSFNRVVRYLGFIRSTFSPQPKRVRYVHSSRLTFVLWLMYTTRPLSVVFASHPFE